MAAVTICSDFGAPQNKVCHCFHCFPIYLPWSDGTRCHDLGFWMLSFKPAFSLSSCTCIKRLFSSFSLSAIRVGHLHIWGYWYFSWQSWFLSQFWTSLWSPHAKSWLIGKDSDSGRDWGLEEKGTTEDEMAGWHHQLNGREFECTLGVGDGQGDLACCDSWVRKESDTTERLNCIDSSMCGSNCCFLTCIQISHEAGQMVWYSHLYKNFPKFVVIHTVNGFCIVSKVEVDVFLELSCFFCHPLAIWSLVPLPFLNLVWTSGSSWFMCSWSLAWRILSITLLACEMSAVVW